MRRKASPRFERSGHPHSKGSDRPRAGSRRCRRMNRSTSGARSSGSAGSADAPGVADGCSIHTKRTGFDSSQVTLRTTLTSGIENPATASQVLRGLFDEGIQVGSIEERHNRTNPRKRTPKEGCPVDPRTAQPPALAHHYLLWPARPDGARSRGLVAPDRTAFSVAQAGRAKRPTLRHGGRRPGLRLAGDPMPATPRSRPGSPTH
jgi:hypothetical protein